MNQKMKKLGLSEEALLFDSPLYILKGFVSVMTAYALFNQHAIIGKDMISVLFGMMMTLEPVTVSGIRSGLGQVKASVLGGVVTAVLVSLIGVNIFSIALSVALTMYFALVMNWRFVSPVAIFTAIYMTQLIQVDAFGAPSMLLTLRLRMLALGAGIAIAILYNYLFSLFFYKSMLKKRMVFIVSTLSELVGQVGREKPEVLKQKAIVLLNDIDLIQGQMADMKREKRNMETYAESIDTLRDLTHQLFSLL